MNIQSEYYKTSLLGLVLKLETVSDKTGNIYHVVTTFKGENDKQYFFFVHLSSALDFINSNFQ